VVTRSFRFLFLFVLAGLSAVGCSPLGPTSPPETLPNTSLTVESFTGTLPLKGAAFYSFSVTEKGTTYLSLISLKEAGVASAVKVTIGLGTPRGTSCSSSNILAVTGDGSLQLTGTTERGVHCAIVLDTGNLTSEATFSLNIVHPR
jgi:hypothetical protein